ncbi:MAG: ATP cone domain-containing protein [Promethearchaeota archaeon]
MQANNIKHVQTDYLDDFVLRNLPGVIRSDGTTERFDPDRIINSLLKETTIPEEEAKRVTEEIVIKFLNSEHELITAPFIREQVCSILFRKNPTWRFEYTRLGIPFYNFKIISGGFFDRFKKSSELTDDVMEKIISTLDKKVLAELIRRMAKDYIGVRNKIRESQDIGKNNDSE